MITKMFLLLNIIFKVMIDRLFFFPKFSQTVNLSKYQNRN